MKKLIIIAFILTLKAGNIYPQGSFFLTAKDTNNRSFIKSAVEKNGNYYLAGGYYNKTIKKNYLLLMRMDKWGNITKKRTIKVKNQQTISSIIAMNDTLRTVIPAYDSTTSKVIIKDFDLNLNIIDSSEYIISTDSSMLGCYDALMDNEGNIIITGGLHDWPYIQNRTIRNKFILKISHQLDSLAFYQTKYDNCKQIINFPNKKQYYFTSYSYNFNVFDYNLNFIKKLRVDTFILTIYDHKLLDDNKIALIGYRPDTNIYNSYHKIIVIKEVDTFGNDYRRIEIDAPDTLSTPGFGNMISQSPDSFLYFTWIKNNNFVSYCNNGEPGYIGIGKYDMNLNLVWINYYGNDSFFYRISYQIATSDGGVLVVGYYKNCLLYDNENYYYALKVDSTGECTFIRNFSIGYEKIKVYPNPTTDYLSISNSNLFSRPVTISIYSIEGRLQKEEKCYETSQPIDVRNLASGIYIINITDSDGKVYLSEFVKN